MYVSRKTLAGLVAALALIGSGMAVGAAGQQVLSPAAPAPQGAVALVGPKPMTRFVKIAPCRIVDTRRAGGRLAAGSIRGFVATNGDLAAQGGFPDGCGIPATAAAIELNATAVDAAGTGYLRLWPNDAPEPTATFLNYAANPNLSNAGTVGLAPPLVEDQKTFMAKAYAQSTHLVIDVFGYYLEGAWVHGKPGGGHAGKSATVVSATRTGVGTYVVTLDQIALLCSATVGTSGSTAGQASASVDSDNPYTVKVSTFDSSGAAADRGYQLQVEC